MTNIVYNNYWEKGQVPLISIITPVYNRRKEFSRAISSVNVQTYKNFEHIIIDDGSIESQSIDDIMSEYMDRASYPVAFVKKENGGVHTARNAGIKTSRGKHILFLDSDDEITPNCLDVFISAWNAIPEKEQDEYWEVVAFCEDEKGKRIGGFLPQDINYLPFEKARDIAQLAEKGEKVGFLRGDIMRSHPWPEPQGVKFVSEGVIWVQLRTKYKSWYINDIARTYHTDTELSICNEGRLRSNQKLIDMLYNGLWFINNGDKFGLSISSTLRYILMHCVLWHVLHWRGAYPRYKWVKEGIVSREKMLLALFLWLPSIFPALLYVYKHS